MKRSENDPLTNGPVGATYTCVTTPGSFGERAQSRSERDGSCYYWGCP